MEEQAERKGRVEWWSGGVGREEARVEWRYGQDVEKRHFCCRILADILQRGRSER